MGKCNEAKHDNWVIHNILLIVCRPLFPGRKKQAREVIYGAEASVLSSGLSIIDVLKNLQQELKDNIFLDEAVRLLSQGKPRSVAYRNILTSEIINMLKSAENRQITAGDIFSGYINLKVIIDKAEGRMRSVLMEPTIMYLMVCFLSFFAVNTFYNNFRGMPKMDMSTIAFIRNYYFFIVLAPIALLHFFIVKFPEKIPLWRKVYKYTKSAGYLLIIKTLVELGMSSVDAIVFFRKLDDKRLLKRINALKRHEKNIEGLTKAISFYLSPVEVALMKTSVKFAGEKRVLSDIVDRRITDVEKVVNGATRLIRQTSYCFCHPAVRDDRLRTFNNIRRSVKGDLTLPDI